MTSVDAQKPAAGQLDSSVWKLTLSLSDEEFRAMEPAAPAMGFGPPPAASPQDDTPRDSVRNLFGMQFPWVRGALRHVSGEQESPILPCRVRYDGDFSYMMAGQSVKRPLFVELRDGNSINGVTAFRLHTMQFDPSGIRERIASHVFASAGATVTATAHAELFLTVGSQEPRYVGLYTVLEAVDSDFLQRHHLAPTALLMQTNGLSTVQFMGEQWRSYATVLRPHREATVAERARIIALARLISNASQDEFDSRIGEFFDPDAVLRYVAASTLTSNLTGLSGIGANDVLCLDTDGRFHLVASQLETALGGSVLSGTPEQLTELRYMRPYAGECRLIDRLLANGSLQDRYRETVRDALADFFASEHMEPVIASLESATAAARRRDAEATEERLRNAVAAVGGGFGPPPGNAPGFGPPPLPDLRTFVARRNDSIARQISGDAPGFTPSVPDFGNFAGPSGGRQGAAQPISESEFQDSVKVPARFQATLFARSPEVNYPVAIAAEPSGAIYVASDEQGSLGTEKGGGKVLRCVDADGDGVVDEVTTFCSVDHVRGVVCRSGSVWVSHPPYLSVFFDDNGDGQADRSQQLVSGLTTEMVNTRGGDHTTNGVRMGIDGWLYIGNGDYGTPGATGRDGSRVTLRGGGILRVRPDGSELELVASGLRNPFDIGIDPQLNLFTRDNTNDGAGWDTRVSQLFPTAEYGYPRLFANFSDEIMPPLGTFGNGGGTGCCFIEDDSWPPPFNRSLFTSDWGRSAVFHHPLTADGPTFALTQHAFAAVPRATGMDLDADGNLFVASWWSGEASVHVGPHVGFVTRISPRQSQPRSFPELNTAPDATLIELLRSPNAVVRFHVQGELLVRGESVIPELIRLCHDPDCPLNGRVAALFAVKQIQGAASHPFLRSMTSDPLLREFAIRALADRRSQREGLEATFFIPFLSDDSPRVRAQAIIALARLGDAAAAGSIVPWAQQSSHQRPDPALPNAAQVIPHLALRALIELHAVQPCLAALQGPYRSAALRVLRSMHSAETVDGLLTQLNDETEMDRRTELLVTLIRLYQHESPYDGSWWGIRPDTTGPYYNPTTWEQSPRIADTLLTELRSADEHVAELLHEELVRHQVRLPGQATTMSSKPVAASQPIVIQPVDPSRPDQLGNMPFEAALNQTLSALAARGDAVSGGTLFRTRSCSACHTSAAGQSPVGPHLADIGQRYQPRELIESILQPSRKIAQGYETQTFVLTSGKIATGFVIRERGQEIIIRDSQGRTHHIPRDSIEERTRRQTSAMPEGLVGSLTVDELADLVAYLQSL